MFGVSIKYLAVQREGQIKDITPVLIEEEGEKTVFDTTFSDAIQNTGHNNREQFS